MSAPWWTKQPGHYLLCLRNDGTVEADGPHPGPEGVARAWHLLAALGQDRGCGFCMIQVSACPQPSAEGVDRGAVAVLNAIGLRPGQGARP